MEMLIFYDTNIKVLSLLIHLIWKLYSYEGVKNSCKDASKLPRKREGEE